MDDGIRFDLPRFTRNYFTTGVVFTHPAFSRQGVRGDICADLLYEAFISLIPFERRDVGSASDRHRTDRQWVSSGQVFTALHDQTYGSLRLSSRVLEGEHLPSVLRRLSSLIDTSGIRESEPFTALALEEFSATADATMETIYVDGPAPAASGGKIKVIMPGSRGINIRRNNEEFEVTRVFFSPTLQAVAYRGRHLGTSHDDVVEIVPVNNLEPTPGESVAGYYDPETGDLEELGVVP
jgi:DEAD/DEAH box helicase domain-containing protein